MESKYEIQAINRCREYKRECESEIARERERYKEGVNVWGEITRNVQNDSK